MANNNNEGVDNSPDNSKEAGSEKSFVGKFMSGIINSTPLSKWFGKDAGSRSVIRRRDEDEDFDASYSFQPPSKRVKLPTDVERNSYSAHVFESPVTVHTSNNVNNVSTKVFGKFPEPVAGPSGIKSRKLFEKHNTSSTNTISTESFENNLGVINGDHDSDSGESTSGYSSAPKLVIKQKSEETSNKDASEKVTPKARSLFTSSADSSSGRTLFPERSSQMNTSLSSRRPTFNASTFGSPNFVDRTLATKRIMNSPFYSGRTMYGGASAYGRRLGKSAEELNIVPRASVQIKPINEKPTSGNTALSKTARRILSTLEQYSTPISDAKKIPISPRKPGLLTSYVGSTPYLTRDRKKALHKELQVPSIPDLLQMKQKERLQNSTETVRQIATKSKSSLNKEEYKLRTEDDNKQKHSNKMKSSVASVRQKAQPIEPVSEVKLPKVSLPITTLPKFDFVLMPPGKSNDANQDVTSKSSKVTKSPVSTIVKPTIVEKKETESKDAQKGKTSDYTFSEPLVISNKMKSVKAINCFKFSEPLCKKKTSDMGTALKFGNGGMMGGLKVKNNGETINFSAGKSTSRLSGSVMDVLGKKKAPSAIGTIASRWECPTCLVKNDSDKTRCVACDEPKPQLDKSENKGFGDQFKLSSDKWECTSCLVRNYSSETKCVACATARPGRDKPAVTSGFGDKFKPPASTWECTSCLIRNKNELDQCAACGTSKVVKGSVASSFGDKFKPSTDTWECGVCMIRNKNELNKCAACETARPGSKDASTQKPVTFTNTSGTTFTFGIKQEWECKTCMIKNKNDLKKCAACETPKDSGASMKTGFGDVFKMKSGEWECTSCMVKNKSTVNVCVCCGVAKPGCASDKLTEISQKEEKKPVNSFNFGIDKSATTQFKFGIPASTSDTKETAVTTAPTFALGDAAKSVTTTASTFSFGINTQEKVAPTKPVTSTSESTTPSVSANPLLKANEKLPEKATPAPVGFKFGLDNSLNKQSSETVVSSTGKTETSAAGTSFVSTPAPVPAFQFKPAAVNGDISKSKGAVFGGDATKSNMFGDVNKSKETIFGTDKTKESSFVNLAKPTESPFSGTTKTTDLSFAVPSKPTDSPFGAANKTTDSPFGVPNKTTDSPFSTNNKTTESPFGTTSKTTDSPFGTTPKSLSAFDAPAKPIGSPFGNTTKSTASPFGGGTSKPTDSPFGGVSKSTNSPFATPTRPTESPFTSTSKPADSPFTTPSKPVDSPFASTSKPTEALFGTMGKNVESSFPTIPKSVESPFGKPNKPADSLFGGISKPTNSPFGNASDINKPKESMFGNPSDPNKPQGSLFGNVNESAKPPAPLFGSDTNKPKEIVFGSKPPENKNPFAPPTTAPFSFTPKPIENTTSAFPAPQPAAGGLFSFGVETSHKRPNTNPSDTNVNGFGTTPKMPAFGGPQSFGTTENKPFAFGADSAPKSSGFSFGPTDKPNAAAPVFNFGNAPPTAPTGGFNFAVPNTGFNFGGAAKVESQPFSAPGGNVFAPAGTGAKNGSFNFGTNANNNNRKAVFSFGGNQTSQQTQPSFPTQSQQPGFNFGAPAAPLNMPGGSFNFAGAPPSFSFTDGNTNPAQPPRKIKKALRRTTHR